MNAVDKGNVQLAISDDAKSLVASLADKFCRLADSFIKHTGRFTVALSGGSTPKALYELLATPEYQNRVNWSKVLFFLGDERCVPHDDGESNFLMINTALLSKIPIPKENVFATQGQDKDPKAAAAQYEESLKKVFAGQGVPQFDLILLGLGPDGHTASLFPESDALKEEARFYVANFVKKFDSYRLTLTYPVLNRAKEVIFLVSGDGKADIVKEVIEGKDKKYPSQFVQPKSGNLTWFMDRAAASKL
jgi:6-phosphogluconolactonase